MRLFFSPVKEEMDLLCGSCFVLIIREPSAELRLFFYVTRVAVIALVTDAFSE